MSVDGLPVSQGVAVEAGICREKMAVDSLTQAVLGASVAYAIGGKAMGRKAALWGVMLGTLPDLDVLVPFDDPVESFTEHRGFSHSLFVLTAISPIIGEGLLRLHKLGKDRRWMLYAMVWLTLITHPILDSLTSYGTQLLWPITTPYAVSSISIVDPLYTVPLLLAALCALVLGSSERWRGRARAGAIGALVISTLYLGWGFGLQGKLMQDVKAQLAAQSISGAHVLVTPTLGNSVLWYVLAVDKDQAYYGWRSLLEPSDAPLELTRLERGSAQLDKLDNQVFAKRLQAFSNGFYQVTREGGRLVLSDLRMGLAPVYVFRFALARYDGEALSSLLPTERVETQNEAGKAAGFSARFIWQRMFDASIRR